MIDKAQAAQTALELRDIHLPDAPSYWPLAPGWWVLIVISCVIIYFVSKFLAKKKHKKKLNNLLQQQLQTIQTEFKQHNDKHRLAIAISELLKRFVRHVLGDSNATSLTGKAWVKYLNQQVDNPVFDEFIVELTQAQYTAKLDYDVPRLLATVKNYFPQAIKAIKTIKSSKHA